MSYGINGGSLMKQALELQEAKKTIGKLTQDVVNAQATISTLEGDKRQNYLVGQEMRLKMQEMEAELKELRQEQSAAAAGLDTRSTTPSATDHVRGDGDDAYIKELELKLKIMTGKTVEQAATIERLQNCLRQNNQFRRQELSHLQNWQTTIGKRIDELVDAQDANDGLIGLDNEQDIKALNDDARLDQEIEALNDSAQDCDIITALMLSEMDLLDIDEERASTPQPYVAAAWDKITMEDMAVIDEIYEDIMLHDGKK